MVISYLIILGILGELRKCHNDKSHYIIALFGLYCIVNVLDTLFLMEVFNLPFHLSDPRNWYFEALNISFHEIWTERLTYAFFYTIEWIYVKVYNDPLVVSLFVRLNNILLIIYTYLLLTKHNKKVGWIDCVMMLNPYILFILCRNMRDIYILFFITIIFLAFNYFENGNTVKKKYGYASILALLTLRPISLIPVGMVYVLQLYRKNKKLGVSLFLLTSVLVLLNFQQLFHIMLNQSVGVAIANGEDATDLEPLFHSTSFGLFIPLLKRYIVGAVAMFFTPHPLNYYDTWLQFKDNFGTFSIYYWFDNILIILGALFSYIFVVPVIFNYCISNNFWRSTAFQYIAFYFIIYVVGYLGITDIRNHHMVYFLCLALILNTKPSLSHKKISYLLVGIIFCALSIMNT